MTAHHRDAGVQTPVASATIATQQQEGACIIKQCYVCKGQLSDESAISLASDIDSIIEYLAKQLPESDPVTSFTESLGLIHIVDVPLSELLNDEATIVICAECAIHGLAAAVR